MDDLLVFDKEAVMERLDGDTELFSELLQMLFGEIDQRMEEIELACSQKNMEDLEKRAHSIKSALGNLGALRAHKLAFDLELAGRNSETDSLTDTFENFKEQIEVFRAAVKDYM